MLADGVRHLLRAGFFDHRAGANRNRFGAALFHVSAGRVRNLLLHTLLDPGARADRHLLGAAFLLVPDGRVGHSLADLLFDVANRGVTDPTGTTLRDSLADSVRNLFAFDLGAVAGRADFLLNRFRAPHATADCLRAAASGRSTIGSTFIATGDIAAWGAGADWNLLGHRFPFAALHVDGVPFVNRLADGVANVAVSGFRHGLVGRARNGFVALVVNRFANRAAYCAVIAGVDRFAGGVVDGLVARLPNRLADLAGDRFVVSRVDRLASGVVHRLVASVDLRNARRVANVAVTSFVNVLDALARNLLDDGIVNRLRALLDFAVVHGFLDDFVLRSAA